MVINSIASPINDGLFVMYSKSFVLYDLSYCKNSLVFNKFTIIGFVSKSASNCLVDDFPYHAVVII